MTPILPESLDTVQTLAVIFDIDDTLMQTSRIEADCFPPRGPGRAGPDHFRPAWGDYEHVTYTSILRDVCDDNNLPNTALDARADHCVEILSAQLHACPELCCQVPGATAVLSKPVTQPDTCLGFATGGWDQPARIKLHHAGIRTGTAAFASSSDAAERIKIMQTCLHRMQRRVDHVVYVGDGNWDARASAALE